jgi:hypothetical protein
MIPIQVSIKKKIVSLMIINIKKIYKIIIVIHQEAKNKLMKICNIQIDQTNMKV